MIVYKYRTDSERTESILKNKEVWFANPTTLNDPLECSIQEIAKNSIEKCCEQEKLEQIEGLIFAYIMTPERGTMYGLSKNKIKKVISRIGEKKEIKEKYKIYADFVKSRTGNYPSNPAAKYNHISEILNNVGIFSLSETCENELMWGHYADGGKGIAIGFNIKDNSSLTDNSLFLKVKYTDTPLILKDRMKAVLALTLGENGKPLFFQSPAFDDPFLKDVMSTKNTTWEYEKEWRCIEQTSGLKHINSPIEEIVFGIKCPQHIREKYISIANENCDKTIRFFEIILDGRTFKKKPLEK